MSEYTPEKLREEARRYASVWGENNPQSNQLRAHAAALEELAAIKAEIAERNKTDPTARLHNVCTT